MPGLPKILLFLFLFYVYRASGLSAFVSRFLQGIMRGLDSENAGSGGNGNRSTSKEDAEVCYRLLGISPSARWEEVERAYKAKAKVHHPDLGGDEDAMRALNEAYHHIKKLRKG